MRAATASESLGDRIRSSGAVTRIQSDGERFVGSTFPSMFRFLARPGCPHACLEISQLRGILSATSVSGNTPLDPRAPLRNVSTHNVVVKKLLEKRVRTAVPFLA
jgi:hypothetical protein